MAARMGLPAGKLLELYVAECAAYTPGTPDTLGTPDRNAN
jgi:hypothetical protein